MQGMRPGMNATQLLPGLRDLYSRHPEYRHLVPWELSQVLWSLNYTDDLEDEGEIAAAAEVADTDWSGRAA
jgi:hypothetical protein